MFPSIKNVSIINGSAVWISIVPHKLTGVEGKIYAVEK